MRRPGPLYLAPKNYRRRRLSDAARLLPLFGAFLMILPVLWAPEAGEARSTGRDGIYLFLVWGALVLAAFGLARALAPVPPAGDRSGGED